MDISLNNLENKFDINAIYFCYLFKYSNLPKCIIGTNYFSRKISELVNIDYFIDDFSNEIYFLTKPIVKLEDLPENTLILSCVVLAKPQSIGKKFESLKYLFCDYFKFKRYSNLQIPDVIFNYEISFKNDFIKNRIEYLKVYNLLSDTESKKTFEKIIRFRLSFDIEHLNGFTYIPDKQYFESFLSLNFKDEVFADVGSYDGYTSLEFIKRCPGYRKVYVFEPDTLNLNLAKKSLNDFQNIIYFNFGLGNNEEKLNFNSSGSSSNLSENGLTTVEIKKMDSLNINDLTFIKLDIEGGESSAIEGASNVIFNCHPTIAISVYHKHDDLWKIPNQILNIRKDYNLFLRHYTEGVIETVMYFVPQKKY
jgi:FkbM family methyltransferase